MRILAQSRLCMISLTLAGLCLAAPAPFASAAKNSTSKGNSATYQVKSGDSLDRIAKKSGTTVAELQRLNQLTSSALKPGQKLQLPTSATKSGKSTGTLAAKAASSKSAKDKTPTATAPTHQVKKGESLYQIARRHKLSVEDLQRWNKLSGTALKPGQKLLLAQQPAAQPEKSQKPAKSEPATTSLSHTVAKGESLYQISRRSGVSVEELTRLNHLPNNRLQPGQTLLLGPAPQMAEADTADTIATPPQDKSIGSTAQLNSEEGVSVPTPLENAEPALLASAEADQERLAKTLGKLRDLPYRFGGNGRNGIDCSGFVQRVFREFAIDLPRSAREQFHLGTPVERGELQQGDLVFFRTYAKYPSHVGIYLGDNKMVHASTRSRKVVISDITQSYYKKRYIGAKRLVNQAPENFHIDQVRDLLQEEADDEEKSAGLTGRKAQPAPRPSVTPG